MRNFIQNPKKLPRFYNSGGSKVTWANVPERSRSDTFNLVKIR
jgi:hypothetical protein